jgi:signal transduction histidine kinase
MVDRVEQMMLALDGLPPASRDAFLEAAPRLGLRISKHALPQNRNVQPGSPFAASLAERLSKNFYVQPLTSSLEHCLPILGGDARNAHEGRDGHTGPTSCEALGIRLHDGTEVRLTVMPPHFLPPPMRSEFFLYLAMFLVIIAVLAYQVARMSMKPVRRLARAATELGNDLNRPPMHEKGASEIVQAAKAFNAMQSRIKQHVQQRTHMLAAITHDLQTPLTRLRLRLEKVDDNDLRDKLIDDLSAMQAMVKEGLELARSMDSNEPMKPLDLDSLLDSVCADAADAGQQVSFSGQPGVTVMARPLALRRCLINLIDNAVKYGQYAKVTLERDTGSRQVQIKVCDGGTGIPADQLDKVFEPFYRIETSRSRDTGGTGLGLTIAQNIARQHGGMLQLANLAGGGLEAKLTLAMRAA